MNLRLVTVGLAAAVCLVAAPAAVASTVTRVGNVLAVTGGAENNALDIPGNSIYDTARVTDGAGITAGSGCTQFDANTADCGADTTVTEADVSLGDGNDTFILHYDYGYAHYPVVIDGGAGNDHIEGGGPGATIHGGPGDDYVSGGSYDDKVYGDDGNDTVKGGGGNDLVDGGAGVDSLSGDGQPLNNEDGNDTILSRDGNAEAVSCGFGADIVTADTADVVAADCESVDRAGGGPAGSPGAPGVSLLGVGSKKIKALWGVGLVVAFHVTDACTATIALHLSAVEAKRTKLGTRQLDLAVMTGSLTAAGDYQGRLKAASKYRAKLKKLRRLVTTIRTSCRNAAGAGRTSAGLTLKT